MVFFVFMVIVSVVLYIFPSLPRERCSDNIHSKTVERISANNYVSFKKITAQSNKLLPQVQEGLSAHLHGVHYQMHSLKGKNIEYLQYHCARWNSEFKERILFSLHSYQRKSLMTLTMSMCLEIFLVLSLFEDNVFLRNCSDIMFSFTSMIWTPKTYYLDLKIIFPVRQYKIDCCTEKTQKNTSFMDEPNPFPYPYLP